MTRRTNIINRIAELAGQAAADQIAQELGGRLVYIRVEPSASMRELEARIFAEFTGDNHAALADKFNLLISEVYRTVHRERARQQQTLSEANLQAWESADPILWACRVTQLNLLTFQQAVLQAAETAKARGCLDRLAIALAILPVAPPATPSADTPAGSPDAPAGSQSCTPAPAGNPLPDSAQAPSA